MEAEGTRHYRSATDRNAILVDQLTRHSVMEELISGNPVELMRKESASQIAHSLRSFAISGILGWWKAEVE